MTRALPAWRTDRRGVALVEFALVLPVLVLLLLGGFQLSQASACKRKVTLVARTVSDLVSQYAATNAGEVDMILGASAQVMAPYPVADADVRVTAVATDALGNASVLWSRARGGVALVRATPVLSLPAAMVRANSHYILAEVSYRYDPALGSLVKPITFSQSLVMVPRKSAAVECPTC